MNGRIGTFERRVLYRAVGFWILVRLTVVIFAGLGGLPLELSVKTSVIVFLIVVFLVMLDTRRLNEDLLLANLGTSPVTVYLLAAAPIVGLELLWTWIL